MNKIYNAKDGCPFEGKKILFDTNVWFAIEGYNIAPGNSKQKDYSSFYSDAKKKKNSIIINDYIIGEFFNRSARLEYELMKEEFKENNNFPGFKEIRRRKDFIEKIETVRDTCLNIVEDCEYVPVNGANCDIAHVINECTKGYIDFSDIIIREHCREKGYVIATDDFDFRNSTVDIITTNIRLLKE